MCLQMSQVFGLTLQFIESTDSRELSDNQPVGLNSRNDRIADGGAKLWRASSPNPCSNQGQITAGCSGLCPAVLYLQMGRDGDEDSTASLGTCFFDSTQYRSPGLLTSFGIVTHPQKSQIKQIHILWGRQLYTQLWYIRCHYIYPRMSN